MAIIIMIADYYEDKRKWYVFASHTFGKWVDIATVSLRFSAEAIQRNLRAAASPPLPPEKSYK